MTHLDAGAEFSNSHSFTLSSTPKTLPPYSKFIFHKRRKKQKSKKSTEDERDGESLDLCVYATTYLYTSMH